MPCTASVWLAANWLVVETKLVLMRTYFLVLSTGRSWSSMAASTSAAFLRRLSPLMRDTVERAAAGFFVWARTGRQGRSAGAKAVSCNIVRREKVVGIGILPV